jgi:hypothetical protein
MVQKVVKKILDIDLDFFLSRKKTEKPMSDLSRLEDDFYLPWDEETTREFLEKQCGLSQKNRVKGAFFVQHDEVFYFLRTLQERNEQALIFEIDHLDAHADLGMGDDSYRYLSELVLWKTLNERPYSNVDGSRQRVTAANYLAFCIACRWVKSVNYVNRSEWSNDLPSFLFKHFDVTGNLMLKKFEKHQMEKIIEFNGGDFWETAKKELPVAVEPEVSFKVIDWVHFQAKETYDFILLTQSPGYTPQTSDKLIPVITSYIDLEAMRTE